MLNDLATMLVLWSHVLCKSREFPLLKTFRSRLRLRKQISRNIFCSKFLLFNTTNFCQRHFKCSRSCGFRSTLLNMVQPWLLVLVYLRKLYQSFSETTVYVSIQHFLLKGPSVAVISLFMRSSRIHTCTYIPIRPFRLAAYALAACRQITRLCCKSVVLKYFRRMSTLREVFNSENFPTKISQFTVYSFTNCFTNHNVVFSHLLAHSLVM